MKALIRFWVERPLLVKLVTVFVVIAGLPPGVELVKVNDISRFTYDMLDTLGSKAAIGFVLVFFTLWAFLRLRLAIWVAVGMPVALLMTLVLMPMIGLGINMLQLKAPRRWPHRSSSAP